MPGPVDLEWRCEWEALSMKFLQAPRRVSSSRASSRSSGQEIEDTLLSPPAHIRRRFMAAPGFALDSRDLVEKKKAEMDPLPPLAFRLSGRIPTIVFVGVVDIRAAP